MVISFGRWLRVGGAREMVGCESRVFRGERGERWSKCLQCGIGLFDPVVSILRVC